MLKRTARGMRPERDGPGSSFKIILGALSSNFCWQIIPKFRRGNCESYIPTGGGGRLFQSLGAATAKATFPQVEVKAFFDLMCTFLASRMDIIPEHDF